MKKKIAGICARQKNREFEEENMNVGHRNETSNINGDKKIGQSTKRVTANEKTKMILLQEIQKERKEGVGNVRPERRLEINCVEVVRVIGWKRIKSMQASKGKEGKESIRPKRSKSRWRGHTEGSRL